MQKRWRVRPERDEDDEPDPCSSASAAARELLLRPVRARNAPVNQGNVFRWQEQRLGNGRARRLAAAAHARLIQNISAARARRGPPRTCERSNRWPSFAPDDPDDPEPLARRARTDRRESRVIGPPRLGPMPRPRRPIERRRSPKPEARRAARSSCCSRAAPPCRSRSNAWSASSPTSANAPGRARQDLPARVDVRLSPSH